MSGQWVDLPTAASLLGTTTEAVRKRATRGTLRSERQDGRVVVWVDEDRTQGGREAQVEGGRVLVEMLTDQVQHLREQLAEEREARRRADTIIAQLTQANAALAARVPELEAPRKATEASETVEGEPERAEPQSGAVGSQGATERTWWRRIFGS